MSNHIRTLWTDVYGVADFLNHQDYLMINLNFDYNKMSLLWNFTLHLRCKHLKCYYFNSILLLFTMPRYQTWIMAAQTWIVSAQTWIVAAQTWIVAAQTWIVAAQT